jgi:PleD family two-component response regulator
MEGRAWAIVPKRRGLMIDGVSILIVEDDPDLREALTDAMAARGYRVCAASDGAEALAQFRAGVRPRVGMAVPPTRSQCLVGRP